MWQGCLAALPIHSLLTDPDFVLGVMCLPCIEGKSKQKLLGGADGMYMPCFLLLSAIRNVDLMAGTLAAILVHEEIWPLDERKDRSLGLQRLFVIPTLDITPFSFLSMSTGTGQGRRSSILFKPLLWVSCFI